MNFGEGIGPTPEDMDNEENSEQDEQQENKLPEVIKYTVELPKSATFSDLVEVVRMEFGEEAAEEVKAEIAYQTQMFPDFDSSQSIFDFYTKEGHDQESIEAWLPILFTD